MATTATSRDHETSVLFSLKELKNLESQRVEDERAAQTAELAEAQRLREEVAAADAAAVEAKRAAAADAQYRIEAARAEAVRQERLAVEAAERVARDQHAAALAAQRQAEELAIKKLEAHKKRPRWMIAVTIFAVVCAGVLGVLTVNAIASSNDANHSAQLAQAERDQAVADEKASTAKIAAIHEQLDQLARDTAAAVERLDKAQGAAEIKRAAADLKAKQAREAKVRADADAAEAERQRKIRRHVVEVKCLDAVCK